MNLKDYRLKKGLSQVHASRKLNITSDYLSMLENKKRTCSIKLINSMAVLYNIKPVDIFLEVNRTICCNNDNKLNNIKCLK